MAIFSTKMIVIYFLYGLAFFTMALVIFSQVRKNSSFVLAKPVWLLSGFGLFQALAEWAKVAKILQIYGIEFLTIQLLHLIDSLTIVISFVFLFLFGMHLVIDTTGMHKHLKFIPLLLTTIWTVKYIIIDLIILPIDSFQVWSANSTALARYTIAFPGALLVSVGLLLQVPELKRLDLKSAYYNCQGAALVFAAYSFFSGLLTFPVDFWPGNILNTEAFLQITGLPVQFFRAFLGILMAYTIIKTINIFNIEQQKRLEEANRINVLMEERERFSRDLHDGIIQSIFGAKMLTSFSQTMLNKDEKTQAIERLDEVKEMLDNTADEIRNFIRDLNERKRESLQQILDNLIEDMRCLTKMPIELINNIKEAIYLNHEQQNNVFYVVHEALFNIIKHAHADECIIKLERKAQDIIIKIIDNGTGFNLQYYLNSRNLEKHGLYNIKTRARQAGGTLTINTEEGQGTEIILSIPFANDSPPVQ